MTQTQLVINQITQKFMIYHSSMQLRTNIYGWDNLSLLQESVR